MSTNENKKFEDQEINLASISKGVAEFIESVKKNIFLMIRFMMKHFVILAVLFCIGVSIGFYLDQTQKTYKNSIIVQPNFDSTDYLYSKIELLNSKIKEEDSLFLKAIGIHDPSSIMNIEIEPIVDIYKFITNSSNRESDHNFQVLKLLAEDGDINKIVTEKTTSKNYTSHNITFSTKKKISRKEIVEPLMTYLEDNSYYSSIRTVYLNNILTKINANKEIIKQIDDLLNNFSKENAESSKKDKLVYYNENTQLNDVLSTKNGLIAEIGRLELDYQSVDKVIKEKSGTLNIHNRKSINGKLKFMFPFVLILCYLMVFYGLNFYKRQARIYAQNKQ